MLRHLAIVILVSSSSKISTSFTRKCMLKINLVLNWCKTLIIYVFFFYENFIEVFINKVMIYVIVNSLSFIKE